MPIVTVPGGGSDSISPAGAGGLSPQQSLRAANLLSRQLGNVAATNSVADGTNTVIGDDSATGAFSIASGTSGLYFVSGNNSVGGAVSIAGGNNTLVGGHTDSPKGLMGNWTITTSGGQTVMWLGNGADSVVTGGSDTVHAGSGNLLIQVASGNTHGPIVDASSGSVTFLGGESGGARISNSGSSGGVIQLGSGGGNVARAGSGNTTLIGGGGGDMLYANTVTGAAGTALYATGNDTLMGGGRGADTFFGYSSISGNGDVLIDVSTARTGQVVLLGGGNDTVKLDSAGADSVVASAAHTDGDGRDLLVGWRANDVLYLDGYSAAPTFTNTSAGLRATLSDGTSITFSGVSNQSAIQIVFGKPG